MGNLGTNNNLVSLVDYGAANNPLHIYSANLYMVNQETRSYNSLFEMTRLTSTAHPGACCTALDVQYNYPTTGNNGKIASQTDVFTGEQVSYTSDALNRLATAVTSDNPSVTQWGQSFGYDGFGNFNNVSVIKGSAPTLSVTYDAATNRRVGESADLNGNILLQSGDVYDIENRLTQTNSSAVAYAYAPDNRRVWRNTLQTPEEFTFWSPAGQKLATYKLQTQGTTIAFTYTSSNVYFGGRLVTKGVDPNNALNLNPVAADRLGSIGKYYPYGWERPGATQNGTEKFTGYFRDAETGLDYADQRYHQPGMGRFLSPDPSVNSGGAGDPGSWNRYAYTRGDPINRTDARGMCDSGDESCFSVDVTAHYDLTISLDTREGHNFRSGPISVLLRNELALQLKRDEV